jgi:hypothetical protein
MDAYNASTAVHCNSLIPFKNSLILKILSLIICVGNCSRSGCSAAVSCYQIASLSPRIAKFPVKFPDTREFGWRQARSALRRQPPIRAFGQAPQETREWAGNHGFSRIRFCLRTPGSPQSISPMLIKCGWIDWSACGRSAHSRPRTSFATHDGHTQKILSKPCAIIASVPSSLL